MKIRQHVEEMFRGIPDSDEKQSLLNEMIADAEEKAADLMAEGKAEEDAVNKALVELGDLSEIKLSLMGASPRKTGGPAQNAQQPPLLPDWQFHDYHADAVHQPILFAALHLVCVSVVRRHLVAAFVAA